MRPYFAKFLLRKCTPFVLAMKNGINHGMDDYYETLLKVNLVYFSIGRKS